MIYPYEDIARQDILRMVPSDGMVIGSVGCGRAATEAVLVKAGRTVHGVDVASEVAPAATPRLSTFRTIGYDDVTPFAEGSLDGLILADVIEHMPQAWDRLARMVRAVKPGGWVIISVPNMRSLKVFKTFILDGEWPEHDTGVFDGTHVQVITAKRLDRWCRAAGLSVEARFYTFLSNVTFKGKLLRAVDLLTFGLFRPWFSLQLQVRCRKR